MMTKKVELISKILLQSVMEFITNVDSLVHLIQIAMDSSQIATRFMANSDRCYKVR